MHRLILAASCMLLLVTFGCKPKTDAVFSRLVASDFTLGIHFGDSQTGVQAVLGVETGKTERQGGASVTEYFLPEGQTALDSDTPQLALTYLQDKLVLVYNRYYPEDETRPFPPHFAEVVPGVKLGQRKSDFVAALGNPNGSTDRDEWSFKSPEGEEIVILAEFVDVPKAGDALCCKLQVAYAPASSQSRGEEYEKRKEAEDKLHNRQAKPDKPAGEGGAASTAQPEGS